MAAKNPLGKESGYKENGLGTPVAEYSEEGPFHCEDCIFQKPGKPDKDHGLCREKHVLKDMRTGRIAKDKESGLAIIKLETGCCRWVRPPKGK